MKTIQNLAAVIFILCVSVLAVISVLGIWNFLARDVIWKSFETLGLLAVVAIIIIVAGRFIGDPQSAGELMPAQPHPGFRAIRNLTLAILIVSSALLALLGVMTIWEVITDKAVLYKSFSSLATLAFSSLVIVVVCLEREKNELWKKRGGQMSGGAIIAAFIFGWILLSTLR